MGCRLRAQSVLHCHGVLALRHGPWTPAWTEAVQNKSRLQEDTSRVAQSVLHCHGVLALRGGPLTGAVPHESQLSDNAGKLAVGSAGTQGKARFELQDDAGKLAVGSAGRQGKARFEASF